MLYLNFVNQPFFKIKIKIQLFRNWTGASFQQKIREIPTRLGPTGKVIL